MSESIRVSPWRDEAMTVRHSDREDFARFLRGEMSSGEIRGMVRNLLATYRHRRQESALLQAGERARSAAFDAEASRFDGLFARSTAHVAERAAALTREREQAAERW